MTFRTAIATVIALITFQLQSQELIPFVENFTKSEYNGDNQIWNVAQGQDKAMYFANNHYFLRYDGVKWERYTLPNKTVIRSIFVDGEKIYCGSYKEFGYWQRVNGKMSYRSLSADKKLFLGNSDNEEIWKIFKHGGKLYFQSFNELFVLNGKTINKIRFPSQISYCYIVDNIIYAASVREGIYKMINGKFEAVRNWDQLKENVIHHIEKYAGKTYIFTKNNGVYFEQKKGLVPWQHPLNDILKNDVIVTARFLANDMLAIGTGLKGLYIVNLKNNSYQNINRQNAIRNNDVLSIAVDSENDIWLGLDNGICHIEISSPVRIFSDNSGILGSVYSLSADKNNYLFASNHGLFTYGKGDLSMVAESQGQVWDIFKYSDQYIIGHNDGTFIFDGNALRKVNPVNGGWKLLDSKIDNAFFQANYSGIAIYPDKSDLTHWKVLEGLTKPIRDIAQSRPNEIWAADNYRGLYRITYDSSFKTTKIENVSQLNHIKDFGVRLFYYKKEILFLMDNSWYVFNRITNLLEKDPTFDKAFRNISDIIPVDDDNFLVVKNNTLYLITQEDNKFQWQIIPQKYYDGKIITENIQAYKNRGRLFINLDDGFFSINLAAIHQKKPVVKVEAFYQHEPLGKGTKVDYNHSLTVNLLSGLFGYDRPELFYKLNEQKGFTPSRNGNLVLSNLKSGNQSLIIYQHDGQRYSPIADYQFSVKRPWYFSFVMVVLYLGLIFLIGYLFYRWNTLRYNQKLKLQEEELKYQRDILELRLKAENELKIQEYEKHILELKVQTKASEVAGKSLSIVKQTEILESIQKTLDVETDPNRLRSQIKKAIKINAINKHEWEAFEANMNQIHSSFLATLTKKYPNLTSKDVKLAIYLRMNLSTKEIAPLMSISFRGVELHRYRLRKKMSLAPDVNLNRYMIDL